jgi:hypothetical protein
VSSDEKDPNEFINSNIHHKDIKAYVKPEKVKLEKEV